MWKVVFDPISDIEHVYTVKAVLESQSPIVLSNVLFGDVWVCSGQSNMKLRVDQVVLVFAAEAVGNKLHLIVMLPTSVGRGIIK